MFTKTTLALVAALALALFSTLAQADLGTLLAKADSRVEVGIASLPNHPRSCQASDKHRVWNAEPGRTFRQYAKDLAAAHPGVTAEDIIKYSGWKPYLDDEVLLMDEMCYGYSTGPNPITVASR